MSKKRMYKILWNFLLNHKQDWVGSHIEIKGVGNVKSLETNSDGDLVIVVES